MIAICLEGVEREGEICIPAPAGSVSLCSVWDWAWATLSFPPVWATVALLPVRPSCFWGHCRSDRDKQKIKLRCFLRFPRNPGQALGSERWARALVLDATLPKSTRCESVEIKAEAEVRESSRWCLEAHGRAKASPPDYISQMCCDITWMSYKAPIA